MHADTIKELTQATEPIAQSVGDLKTTVGVGQDGALVTVDDRARLIMGQNYPVLDAGVEERARHHLDGHQRDGANQEYPGYRAGCRGWYPHH